MYKNVLLEVGLKTLYIYLLGIVHVLVKMEAVIKKWHRISNRPRWSKIGYLVLVEIYSLSIANTAIWLVTVLTIYQVIASVGWKWVIQYGGLFPLFRRRLGRGLNALIQKAIPEKTKIAGKYGLREGKKRIWRISLTVSLDE